MVFNKKRLYIALYPSPIAEDGLLKYHWSFLIGPKYEDKGEVPGTRYHVKKVPTTGKWMYEARPLQNIQGEIRLLARVLIAKVTDEQRLIKIFQDTPILDNNSKFNSLSWVIDAFSRISKNREAVGTAILDWKKVEDKTRTYVERKAAEGRYSIGQDMTKPKPTWDMLAGAEIIS
ncbi:uncharacterized protein F4822DRAFT_89658 [Hypoxylon trugodes]|uniref:uncharacterized protein n=1 Tax=Hypoxylon trugodes TaxID=326681 RepID=UPI002195D275|nr:uncharacterized protein F4822DRAFT_89658 [Hypoxylon trugodes]KAI1383018.1 hypothetical protein F4822DRAFT_89658 [Hypoxylon trugodes]